MNRIACRIATITVTAVSALAAVLAFGSPAHADPTATATFTWMGDGADYAVVQLNEEAVRSATDYDAGLGWAVDDLCGQITDVLNGHRQSRGYTVGLATSDCIAIWRHCVAIRSNNRVQFSVFADLTYRCGQY
ncbi:MAG TPA: hypothetical protein VHW64_14925 [Nocardioides sp.]|jgi:hypothetical protein|uniref:hypothetical protein n=1 Tax=Nocardioides sp. TaxID=35761 RepID=UPI002E38056D|nr:hypothetical protein [Nocardioides sp.]HEX3931994.1 hypothetical protein [Nocardioides sp.]